MKILNAILLISSLCSIPKTVLSKQEPFVVNIDNPKFRKLVMAIPNFKIFPENDSQLLEWVEKGPKEIAKLYQFSGYFSVLDRDISNRVSLKPIQKIKNSIPGFDHYDLQLWKQIGSEALNTVVIKKDLEKKYKIELRTADLVQGKSILGKAYTINSLENLDRVFKRYIDETLVSYTGKPGIFSSRLLFIGRKTKKSQKQVYLADVDGTHVEQLTHTNSLHVSPAWSPDGHSVMFTSYESGNPDLYILDLKTRKKSVFSAYKGLNSGGSFSSNGKLVAYSGSIEGNTEIFLKNTTNLKDHRIPLLKGYGLDVDPTFSPDGKYLAFVSGRYGNPHIFRATLSWTKNTEKVEVVDDLRLTYAGWYNATPAWSPDSKKLAFAGFDKDINRFDLFLMNNDGSSLERLTLNSGDNESPSWSPNGQLIMFHSNRIQQSNKKGPFQLYIMNRDGSAQSLIKTGLYEAQTPRWGPPQLINL